MQLKRGVRRGTALTQAGGSLAAATCALLGPGTPTTVKAQELQPWDFDTALLYYGEGDGRVRDLSFNALATKELREDSFLRLTLAVDTLTGATPTGAVPSTQPQTFTRPSGNGVYTVPAGQIQLDDTFHDSRTALSASWEWPLQRLTKMTVGASLSDEYDYTHTGLDARIARDFNNRNTTLSFGVAVANDTINPVGGTPVPLSEMLGPVGDDNDGKGPNQSKDVTDFLIGVTQVLNRRTIVQFNYSLSQSDGYLTDPYKILSVVDPVTGLPIPGPVGSGIDLRLYENRPGTRDKESLYGLLKRDLNGSVFDISYRYMTDDWGVDSQTIDMHYRRQLERGKYIEPHLRFYTQTAADFFTTLLFDGEPLPTFASADYRLAEFDAVTFGVKFGARTRYGELSTRIELYKQTGNPSPGAAVGALAGLDLYPGLDAVIAQVSYKFGR